MGIALGIMLHARAGNTYHAAVLGILLHARAGNTYLAVVLGIALGILLLAKT